jgi:glucosamine--fructose-6-phosphate aminotransferase (isomerizing)
MRACSALESQGAAPGGAEDTGGADEVIPVPRIEPALQPLLAIVPLQLFAHEVARLRGLDVDRPRNLAKTVTVE